MSILLKAIVDILIEARNARLHLLGKPINLIKDVLFLLFRISLISLSLLDFIIDVLNLTFFEQYLLFLTLQGVN